MSHQLLNRLSFGPIASAQKRLEELGYVAFLEEQLYPPSTIAPALQKRKDAFKFVVDKAHYKNRGFQYYNAPLKETWKLLDQNIQDKIYLPPSEVIVNNCFQAIYSEWQLEELLVQFWHNHFSVSVEADQRVGLALPTYDKSIRQHAFGNFRVLLEAIATSPAMLFYLDNASSRASPANENFARELFELHTMGRAAYLANDYAHWKEVPGAKEGKAIGYIEEDIYEAARAFTGWSIAYGSKEDADTRPDTGEFMYVDSWHDHYQKRVLGVEFSAHQAPLKDGQMVLDLVAFHEKTAYFLCTKLCRYFVADEPPTDLVKRAAQLWIKTQKSPDQIRQVLRFILSSKEFHASLGTKFKTPFQLLLSLFRSLQVEVVPNLHLRWMLGELGQMPFSAPAPDGFPDRAEHWSSSNMLLQRWNVMPKLLYSNWHKIFSNFEQLFLDTQQSSQAIVQQCLERLLGKKQATAFKHKEHLMALLLRENKTADQAPLIYNAEDKKYLFAQLWAFVAMTPEFQYR
ncbi:MAG: DUF1800 domain-containing protein [Aureispira sp.]